MILEGSMRRDTSNAEKSNDINLVNKTVISRREFENNIDLTEITLPNGLQGIEDFAFKNCSKLKKITIPNSVTFIGKGAFIECTSLEKVTLPNTITNIPAACFVKCTNLTSITLPNTVTKISNLAFFLCIRLQSISNTEGLRHIENRAFGYCHSLESFNISENITTILPFTFCNNTSLKTITIPPSVRTIMKCSFANCNKLKNIIFSGAVHPSIHSQAFQNSTHAAAIIKTHYKALEIVINKTCSNIQPSAVAYYTSLQRFNNLFWLHALNQIHCPYSPESFTSDLNNRSYFHCHSDQYNMIMSLKVNSLCRLLERFIPQIETINSEQTEKIVKLSLITNLLNFNLDPERASFFSAFLLLNNICSDAPIIVQLLPDKNKNNLSDIEYLSRLYTIIMNILKNVRHQRHAPVDMALEALTSHYFIHWYSNAEKKIAYNIRSQLDITDEKKINNSLNEIRTKKNIFFQRVTTLLHDMQSRHVKYAKCITGLLGIDNLSPILKGIHDTATLEEINEFHQRLAIENKVHSPGFFLTRRTETPTELLRNSLSPCHI